MSGQEEMEENEQQLLAELREISNRSKASSRFEQSTCTTHSSFSKQKVDDSQAEGGSNFFQSNPEKGQFNQYWYSNHTIKILLEAIQEILPEKGGRKRRVAFLSTPSLYFAMSESDRSSSYVFEYDNVWSNDPRFVFYDFNKPTDIDENLRGKFDMVVIDPPFLAQEVWENYAASARFLLEHDPLDSDLDKRGLIIGTTILENKETMKRLFGAEPCNFLPSCPNLVYQFAVYTNHDNCETLKQVNEELA